MSNSGKDLGKTIIFDIGNVIVSFDHSRIAEKFRRMRGNSESNETATAVSATLVRSYNLGLVSTKQFFDSVNLELQSNMSFEYFCDAWNSTFGRDPLIPEQFIHELAGDFRLLALSDTNELHFTYLRREFPILNRFDDFILSFEVGLLKPSSQIFEIALEKSNCSADQCVFIDDMQMNVEGAEKAGLKAVRFYSFPELVDQLRSTVLRRV
jgi:FMN phosphatase YigB (HAD superfamily)